MPIPPCIGTISFDTRCSVSLAFALASETNESVHMYPAMALTAREEGFDEIADWFETLAKAERSHTIRYEKALKELLD